MIRLSTGNQWRSFNTGVMCSRFLDNVTNRAAAFWMRCNLLNSNFGSPYKMLLFESRREETKAWTSFSVLLRSKYLRMRPMFLIECEARRLTARRQFVYLIHPGRLRYKQNTLNVEILRSAEHFFITNPNEKNRFIFQLFGMKTPDLHEIHVENRSNAIYDVHREKENNMLSKICHVNFQCLFCQQSEETRKMKHFFWSFYKSIFTTTCKTKTLLFV